MSYFNLTNLRHKMQTTVKGNHSTLLTGPTYMNVTMVMLQNEIAFSQLADIILLT